MKVKIKSVVFLVIVLALLLATVVGASATKWTDVRLNAGEGVRVSCSTGIVSAYVDDGMAVVECLPLSTSDRKR